jgi:hypothetical protein
MHGEDVGLVDRRQADRLVRLDVGQRADAVAQDGGAFEFETDRGLVHALGQCLLDLAVASAQEAAHLVDDGAVLGVVDAADAGAVQRLIWYCRQGRVRVENTPSEHERSGKARCSA